MTTRTRHFIFSFFIFLFLAWFQLASGQNLSRPGVPDQIRAPVSEEVVLEAHASGVQIYTCQKGAEGRPAWVLQGPEAELRDSQGTVIGQHYAGPTWKLNDGSQVTGKAVALVDSPDRDSIPWLLLSAIGHSGDGAISRVTSIQRIHTQGGQPPPEADCNRSRESFETKSPYRADYYFYAPGR